ncbi:MAG: YaiO family outer membrane beta-barrel protein [Candidatus Acetothermia bacterium]|jgi:YaiO family outer membrane protein|nr:YaiO family outer membrane beta-barrel protein [Candidatus Acetothermia bacterium]MDH7505227.1 YaiO family outer membrane beta-barrel protein [Candidatus Acetothermia bacterium]
MKPLGLGLGLLVLAAGLALAEPEGQFELAAYYRHSARSSSERGVKIRYEARSGQLVSIWELVGAGRGASRGASLGYAMHYDLSPDLFICGGASLSLGAGLFPKSRVSLELDLKVPHYKALVLAAGLGRNEYEHGSDIQADAGLTLYGEAFTAYYRWFGFWSSPDRLEASQQILQLALRPGARAELGLTLLLASPGEPEGAGQILTISYRFWPAPQRGWRGTLELGRQGGKLERLGLEIGHLLALP